MLRLGRAPPRPARAPPSAAQETVVTGISTDNIALNANFDGSELFVFGAVRRDGPPPPDAGPLDVIITVKGPPRTVKVRRKERRFGIWVNTDSVAVRQAPSFYAIATTRPLDEHPERDRAAALPDRHGPGGAPGRRPRHHRGHHPLHRRPGPPARAGRRLPAARRRGRPRRGDAVPDPHRHAGEPRRGRLRGRVLPGARPAGHQLRRHDHPRREDRHRALALQPSPATGRCSTAWSRSPLALAAGWLAAEGLPPRAGD